MRLGRIDYLNCYPFYYHMLEKAPLPGVELFPRLPSELNRMMAAGELDLSPVSAGAWPDIAGRAALLPDFCISSEGAVGSVVLISRRPVEELGGKRLALSSASRTSVVLLKMLLRKFYSVEPVYEPSGPQPSLADCDAALLIGDHALTDEAAAAPFRYDLGELWPGKTGRPVVFAVFAAGKAAAAADPGAFRSVAGSYAASLDCLVSERPALLAAASRRYPAARVDMDRYLAGLRYVFTPARKEAFKFYLDTAAELGLLGRAEPEYLGL
ncbi:MAG: menaquinone biosynthesis protein [Elusimicrobia bacterium]|nr:menaquinone biosynthesis protein [Elusimicrobiota bacterium]